MARIVTPRDEPYPPKWGCLDTLVDYNRYLILKAAQEVGKGDVFITRLIFETLCRIMVLPVSDFFYAFYDHVIAGIEPKMYRRYVLLAKKL